MRQTNINQFLGEQKIIAFPINFPLNFTFEAIQSKIAQFDDLHCKKKNERNSFTQIYFENSASSNESLDNFNRSVYLCLHNFCFAGTPKSWRRISNALYRTYKVCNPEHDRDNLQVETSFETP